MGLISWLAKKLGGSVPLSGSQIDEAIEQYFNEVHIREVAFWSTVNLIANAISKCEFKTYVDGKERKGDEYYLWNVEPNKNQNSSSFIHKWISKLYAENECLIIESNGQLLVADSYEKTPYAVYEDVFSQVTVKDFTFNRTFKQSEVLYFELYQKDMRKVTNALYESYLKLISYAMKAFQKSRGTKGIFTYDTIPVSGTEERKVFDSLINEKFKHFMESGDSIIPLGKGQSFTDIGSKTYANESTRDIRAMIDDISDFTAKAFGVPPALLRGDVQGVSDVVDQLLTFCIDPLCDMLQEEINRKRIGKANFLKGTKIIIDTKAIKHIDLLDVSTSIDKLISSGCFTINDIRKIVGEEPVDEEWANQFFMTKNYASVEDLLKGLEGGEKS
ncbi:phage portal protein [Clostridium thermarum]|uniref:phage portal protein n=1 Tax=Clostridium thermarum TaxID=1716543 RepID=UPI001FAA2F0B|nr:phage portal protein [Clostridium thermarum]